MRLRRLVPLSQLGAGASARLYDHERDVSTTDKCIQIDTIVYGKPRVDGVR